MSVIVLCPEDLLRTTRVAVLYELNRKMTVITDSIYRCVLQRFSTDVCPECLTQIYVIRGEIRDHDYGRSLLGVWRNV